MAAFFRRRYPVKTAINVAADLGVSEDTIRGMMERGTMPGFRTLCRMMIHYGPELLVATMDECPAWVMSAARQEEDQ